MKYENQHLMKTTNIKGNNDYVMVAERIAYLNSSYFPFEYSLTSEYQYLPDVQTYIVKATFTIHKPDGDLIYTGLADERVGSNYINKDNALENCQTSAWGRAIAGAGIGYVGNKMASAEEMKKGERYVKKVEEQPKNEKPKMTVTILKNIESYCLEGCNTKADVDKAEKRCNDYKCSKAQTGRITVALSSARNRILKWNEQNKKANNNE